MADREYEMSNHIRMQPHPCIVTLYQVNCFSDKGFYMIVMEFCPHGDPTKSHVTQNWYDAIETRLTKRAPYSSPRINRPPPDGS
jgi:hypothetical protein